jgi:hypothetical protein
VLNDIKVLLKEKFYYTEKDKIEKELENSYWSIVKFQDKIYQESALK